MCHPKVEGSSGRKRHYDLHNPQENDAQLSMPRSIFVDFGDLHRSLPEIHSATSRDKVCPISLGEKLQRSGAITGARAEALTGSDNFFPK